MNKKHILLSFALLGVLTCGAMGAFIAANKTLNTVSADKTYTLKLDSSTDLNNVTTVDGNKIVFNANVGKVPGHLATFSANDKLSNATPLRGISAIRMDYDKSIEGIKLGFGFIENDEPQLMYSNITFTGEYLFNGDNWKYKKPNYFEFSFTNKTTVNSIEIDYGCLNVDESGYTPYKVNWEMVIDHTEGSFSQRKEKLEYNSLNGNTTYAEYVKTLDLRVNDRIHIESDKYRNNKNDFDLSNPLFKDNTLQMQDNGDILVLVDGNYTLYWKGGNQGSWINLNNKKVTKISNFSITFKLNNAVPDYLFPIMLGSIDNWDNPSEVEDDLNIAKINKGTCEAVDATRKVWKRTYETAETGIHQFKVIFVYQDAKSIKWANSLTNDNQEIQIKNTFGNNYNLVLNNEYQFDFNKIPAPKKDVTVFNYTTNQLLKCNFNCHLDNGNDEYKGDMYCKEGDVLEFGYGSDRAIPFGFPQDINNVNKIQPIANTTKAKVLTTGNFTFKLQLGFYNNNPSYTIYIIWSK